MLQNRFHASINWNMCFSHVGCRSYSERLPCAERWRAVFEKRFLRDTRLRIFKLDTFENVTFVLPPTPHPLHSAAEGEEDFSNELPSSSSLPSSASSSSDRPHSHAVPRPESPGNLRLEVAAPHYHEDQLQVKVYWKMSQHGELFYLTNQKGKKKEADLRPRIEESCIVYLCAVKPRKICTGRILYQQQQ